MAAALRLPEQNQVLLVGRLTRDPDVRFTQKGQAWARFDIAVNRRYKDAASGEWKEIVCFVPVVVWGPAAERCRDRLKKGSPVHVEGRLEMNDWTDKSGQKRRTLQVQTRRLQVLASETDAPAEASVHAEGEPSSEPQAEPSPEAMDDVPF
ncbi:MAG: single-stranded DNA-binding protein [Elusimicrobiales bacterium]